MISPTQRPLPDKTHSTNNRQPSKPPAGCETAIPTSERPQNHAFDRADTGMNVCNIDDDDDDDDDNNNNNNLKLTFGESELPTLYLESEVNKPL